MVTAGIGWGMQFYPSIILSDTRAVVKEDGIPRTLEAMTGLLLADGLTVYQLNPGSAARAESDLWRGVGRLPVPVRSAAESAATAGRLLHACPDCSGKARASAGALCPWHIHSCRGAIFPSVACGYMATCLPSDL